MKTKSALGLIYTQELMNRNYIKTNSALQLTYTQESRNKKQCKGAMEHGKGTNLQFGILRFYLFKDLIL